MGPMGDLKHIKIKKEVVLSSPDLSAELWTGAIKI